MKKNMLILLALLITLTSIFAMDIEIGDGTTTTSYIPAYGLYDNGWSTFIINSNLIGMAAEFNEIKISVSSNTTGYVFENQKIYFKETTEATVTNDYPAPLTNGFTLVYDGDVTFNGPGYQGVMLDTPFAYNGTSNLQIVWENHDGAWTSGYPTYYTTNVGSNVGAYKYADTNFPEVSGSYAQFFPNIILSFAAENEPTLATLVAPAHEAMNVSTNVALQWIMGDNVTDVDVYFSSTRSDVANMEASALVVNGQNVTSYQANNLSILTDYFWLVKSRNTANGLVATGPVWKFSTEAGEGIVAVGIGNGTATTYSHPLNFWYKTSVAETIYLAEEINIAGDLTTISFFNNFSTNLTDKQVNIWMGEIGRAHV